LTTFQLMQDHVRAIYRALTGSDLPESPQSPPGATEPPPPEMLARSFADLDARARSIPAVAERVAPFSFAPPLDAYRSGRELIIEVAAPGVARDEVRVELSGDTLLVEGSRSTEGIVDGRTYYHAEIPRGPFRRVVRLPIAVVGEPRVEVESGLVRVRLATAAKAPPARA
jgi:HSP20 family molecular chaperone IbpA